MRITELFTAQSIALDEALQTQEQILSRLVELQATHGNIPVSPCPTPRPMWSPVPVWLPCG